MLNQFTSGIYYLAEIYEEKKYGLANDFGSAFEDYVGLILEKNSNTSKFTIRKEITYEVKNSKNEKNNKTSDWIIEPKNAIVMIECKTKRLQIKSKGIDDILASDIKGIADAVMQIYKVYAHYLQNIIPDLKFDPNKNLIPIILTLEEWFAGIPDFNEQVMEIVKSQLKGKGLDESFVDSFKFKVMSISSFETEVQLMAKVGFKEYYFLSGTNMYGKYAYKRLALFTNSTLSVRT